MSRIIGISGSLRKGSLNTALLRAAQEMCPELVSCGTIRGIPLYDGDVEQQDGIPAAVERLQQQIAAADGLLLVTPEYNNSMPGVFKNALDWLSRPPAESARIFRNKPVALIGATPGGFGTILGQAAWLPVLRALGVNQWFSGRLLAAHAHKLFDENGALTDPAMRDRLHQFIRDFDAFIG